VRVGDGHLVVVCRLCVDAAVDLVGGGEIEIPDLQTKAGRLNEGFGEGVDADVVGFTRHGLNVVCAVGLDVAHGHKVPEVIGVRLHPGTGKQLRGSADDAAGEGTGFLL
jgi:hypothetical protein